jgi:hypothetical protein
MTGGVVQEIEELTGGDSHCARQSLDRPATAIQSSAIPSFLRNDEADIVIAGLKGSKRPSFTKCSQDRPACGHGRHVATRSTTTAS